MQPIAISGGKVPGSSITLKDTVPVYVGTSITEGTANFLVNRCMNKSQQVRRSRRGGDLLLKVRCAVYDGTLGSGFGHRFEAFANPKPMLASVA